MARLPTDAVAIAAAVSASDAKLGSTRLVCIDGPAGSGKTTLARTVETALAGLGHDVVTLHMDDFYEGWDGLGPGLEPRLLAQVLEPLAGGHSARWQRYDWHEERFADWSELPTSDVLVIEGCGSGARAYAAYRSLLVWVVAPRAVRLRRAVERDGADVLPRWLEWMDAEAAHFALNNTSAEADVRLGAR